MKHAETQQATLTFGSLLLHSASYTLINGSDAACCSRDLLNVRAVKIKAKSVCIFAFLLLLSLLSSIGVCNFSINHIAPFLFAFDSTDDDDCDAATPFSSGGGTHLASRTSSEFEPSSASCFRSFSHEFRSSRAHQLSVIAARRRVKVTHFSFIYLRLSSFLPLSLTLFFLRR